MWLQLLKELNAIIANYHDDTAAIRRYMIEYGILERDSESVYRLSEFEVIIPIPHDSKNINRDQVDF